MSLIRFVYYYYNNQKRRWMMSMYAAGLAKSTTRSEEQQQEQQLFQGHIPHQITKNSQAFDNGNNAASTTTSPCPEALTLQHTEEDPLFVPLPEPPSLEQPERVPGTFFYSSSSNTGDGNNNISGTVSGKGTAVRGRVAVGGRVRSEGYGNITTIPWDGGGEFLDQQGEGDEDALLVEWSAGLDFDRQEYAASRKKA